MNEMPYSDLSDQTITFDIFDGLLDQIMSLISYCQYEFYAIHNTLGVCVYCSFFFFINEYSVTILFRVGWIVSAVWKWIFNEGTQPYTRYCMFHDNNAYRHGVNIQWKIIPWNDKRDQTCYAWRFYI